MQGVCLRSAFLDKKVTWNSGSNFNFCNYSNCLQNYQILIHMGWISVIDSCWDMWPNYTTNTDNMVPQHLQYLSPDASSLHHVSMSDMLTLKTDTVWPHNHHRDKERLDCCTKSPKTSLTYRSVPAEEWLCCSGKTVINRSVQVTHREVSNSSEQGGSAAQPL